MSAAQDLESLSAKFGAHYGWRVCFFASAAPALLVVAIRKIMPESDVWTESRRQLAAKYDETLKAKGFRVLNPQVPATPVYHIYLVEVSNRDEVMKAFKESFSRQGGERPERGRATP